MAMMMTVVEVDVEDFVRNPALHSCGTTDEVYFIRDNEVVGIGKYDGGSNMEANIIPIDDRALELFKDDFALNNPTLGIRHMNLKYFVPTGRPAHGFIDEPEDRHRGTRVVDKMMFDHGLLSSRDYCIKGYKCLSYDRENISITAERSDPKSLNLNVNGAEVSLDWVAVDTLIHQLTRIKKTMEKTA